MPSPAQRARVQAGFDALLIRLRATCGVRDALAEPARSRAAARPLRPLNHWLARHEAERDAHDQMLSDLARAA
jgi:hypothetical protein